MTIWLLTGLLSILVLFVLILPMFRRRPAGQGHEAGVYASQAAEIENDRALGLIDQNEADTLTKEIAQRLAVATEDAATGAAGPSAEVPAGVPNSAGLAVAIGIVVLVPLFSFAVYGWLGAPALPGLPYASRGPDVDPETQSLRKVVETLAARMQQSPDRLEGWQLLGRSSMQISDYSQAAHAFRQATRLAPADADMYAALAEALFMAAGQKFAPEARAALKDALKSNPRLAKALFYQGLAHFQAGEHGPAVQRWTDLVAISPPGAPYLDSVRRQIANAAKAGGIDLGSVRPGLAPATPASGAPSVGPSRQEVEAASKMSKAERAKFIRSMVARLAARLKEQPGDAAGWRRLARAYSVLGEPEKAAEAEARAKQIEAASKGGRSPGKSP
jgi:cytochrome c-type biogenesis protein CcmH